MRYAILLVVTGLLLTACYAPPESRQEKTAVQKPAAAHAQKAAGKVYSCPMHEKFVTSDPDRKCGECGMNCQEVEGKVTYGCPMCPGHESDKPGKCSGCGMNLEPVTVEKVTYGCPMCPGHESDKPGKCSGCGMNLEPVAAETATYGCPMCPGHESDKPGKCSGCGMNLVPVTADAAAEHPGGEGHGG